MKRNVPYIADRGGKFLRGEIVDASRVKWRRIRDDVSECEVVIRFVSEDCHQLVAQAEPVRDEIVIVRDGKRVWEGPIVYAKIERGEAILRARDVLFFTQRRVCHRRWNNTRIVGEDKVATVIDRAQAILEDEMRDWERAGANLLDHVVYYRSAGIAKTTRETEPYSQYVWDDLEAMAARGGLDYSVTNRSLYLHDTHSFLGIGRTLVDSDFLDSLQIVKYGVELAVGSYTTDNTGKHGERIVTDAYYGPVELLASAYDLRSSTDKITQEELDDQAQRNQRHRYPVPVVIRVPEQVTMNPATVDELMGRWLVPGTAFPVETQVTGKTYAATMKLDEVSVEEDAAGEKVRVKLGSAPLGSGYEGTGEVG